MRKIPDPPGGSAQWQNGWENGYEQALIDADRAERAERHDGPRTWQIEYPPAPPAGTRVRTRGGTECTVGEDEHVERAGVHYSWKYVLEEFAPLTEVVETEVEAAARRLRESDSWRGGEHATDVATVLTHVLNGGQL